MKASEAFLVNTKNFESIIDTVVNYDADEPVINSGLLEILGYSDPNDLLVIRLLKDYNVIDNEGKPGKHYTEFRNPETTKIALAKGLIEAHEYLFEQYPQVHQDTPEKIKTAFEEIFQGKKTELIIKYITGTFQKVISYIGIATINAVLNSQVTEASMATIKSGESQTNGVDKTADTKAKIPDEQVGDKIIDDLLTDFDVQQSTDHMPTDKKSESSVQEFVNENSRTEEEEDDPFNFEIAENGSEITKPTAEKSTIDMDPFDLETSLTSAVPNTNNMKNVTTEHTFVQKALLRKSDLLHKMHRWEELLPTLETIIKRYDNEKSPTLSDAVSRAIVRRATALLKLNRTEEALPALDLVIRKFANSEKQEFFDQASRAMLYKVQVLEKNGGADLLPLYNSIIDRLDTNSEIVLKEKLDEIHLKRFDLIIADGEHAEILDASMKLIKRFKNREQHQEYLQKAMMMRAEILDEMGRDEEALKAYDEFLAAFS